jgi:glyoxylate/hydroxypyruvate reductase A
MTLLYKGDMDRGREWARLLALKAPELPVFVWPETGDLHAVRYLAAWQPPVDFMRTMPNLEVVFSVGAGIDQFDLSSIPPHVTLVRMMEPGIVESMVQYVLQAVLTLHRDFIQYSVQQKQHTWREIPVRPASSTRIGVLGLGMLGTAVLQTLSSLGFPCAGWSRSAHSMEGIDCFAGTASLKAFLERTDILVCLLPLTDETRGLLDKQVFDSLPRGASVINVGRGPHVNQTDLLDALDSGQLYAAILDVTDPEPLPPAHPFWSHPQVRLTPHVASNTRPESAIEVLLENLRRHRTGEPLIGTVDRMRGY